MEVEGEGGKMMWEGYSEWRWRVRVDGEGGG